MKLFHGSKNGKLVLIKRQKAEAGEGVEVPEDELLEAIYLTSDYGYALAMAARPKGLTNIDDQKRTVEFEDPKLFDPEEAVYVYEIEVPEDKTRKIDELQYVVEDMDGVEPINIFEHKAGDIEQYYELTNWKKREGTEVGLEFKIR